MAAVLTWRHLSMSRTNGIFLRSQRTEGPDQTTWLREWTRQANLLTDCTWRYRLDFTVERSFNLVFILTPNLSLKASVVVVPRILPCSPLPRTSSTPVSLLVRIASFNQPPKTHRQERCSTHSASLPCPQGTSPSVTYLSLIACRRV